MPVTPDELLEAIRRLADSNFALAARLNRVTNSLEPATRDLYDLKQALELDQAALSMTLNKINERLALIDREVTNPRIPLLPPAEDDKVTKTMKVIDKLESLKTSTKIFLLVLVIVIAASGWITHLIHMAVKSE